jgi:acyl carrier protein
MSSIFDRIRKVIAATWDVDEAEVTPDARFDETERDSLDRVQLMMAIEEEFGIEIPDEEAVKLDTAGKWARYIEERTTGGQA